MYKKSSRISELFFHLISLLGLACSQSLVVYDVYFEKSGQSYFYSKLYVSFSIVLFF